MSARFKCFTAVGSAALLIAGLASAHAQDKKYDIVTVVKINGIQWFNRMEEGVKKFATDTGNNAYQAWPGQGRRAASDGDSRGGDCAESRRDSGRAVFSRSS